MKNLLAMLAIMTGLLVSPQSKSFVGLASGDDNAAIIGLALMDLSSITVVEHRHVRYRRGYRRTVYTTYRVLTFPAFLVAGLVMLDDQGSTQFTDSISQEAADKAGLTEKEISAIEDNAEELTLIKNTIVSETAQIEGLEEKSAAAAKLWVEYGETLPVEALIGLQKMATVK